MQNTRYYRLGHLRSKRNGYTVLFTTNIVGKDNIKLEVVKKVINNSQKTISPKKEYGDLNEEERIGFHSQNYDIHIYKEKHSSAEDAFLCGCVALEVITDYFKYDNINEGVIQV